MKKWFEDINFEALLIAFFSALILLFILALSICGLVCFAMLFPIPIALFIIAGFVLIFYAIYKHVR